MVFSTGWVRMRINTITKILISNGTKVSVKWLPDIAHKGNIRIGASTDHSNFVKKTLARVDSTVARGEAVDLLIADILEVQFDVFNTN